MRGRHMLAAVVALGFLAAGRAEAQPKPLRTAAEIMAALSSGRQVRAVLHYKDMALVDEKGAPRNNPHAVGWDGSRDVRCTSPRAPSATRRVLRRLAYPAHPPSAGRDVLNYVKLSVYDNGTVKIVAQYLSPTTYEVRMDETFTTTVADGANKGAAILLRHRGALTTPANDSATTPSPRQPSSGQSPLWVVIFLTMAVFRLAWTRHTAHHRGGRSEEPPILQ